MCKPITLVVAASLCLGCPANEPAKPPRELAAPTTATIGPVGTAATVVTTATATAAAKPQRLADDEALREGLVELSGMLRPTKGGLDLRGVTLALETIHAALPPKDRQLGYDELLGAKLSVVAELEAQQSEASDGGLAVQSRGGTWLSARRLLYASILRPAVVIEGKVARSKGLYAIGKHLVNRDDFAWALRGIDPIGKRLRLWGQPRTYVCPPETQCLIGGSLPMFDVARAELVQ